MSVLEREREGCVCVEELAILLCMLCLQFLTCEVKKKFTLVWILFKNFRRQIKLITVCLLATVAMSVVEVSSILCRQKECSWIIVSRRIFKSEQSVVECTHLWNIFHVRRDVTLLYNDKIPVKRWK